MTMSTLETLRIAHANLRDETQPFEFGLWNTCTCGFIYGAAVGRTAWDQAEVIDAAYEPGIYANVILDVAHALGSNADSADQAARYVSNYTADLVSGWFEKRRVPKRRHAIQVIEDAIAVIELREAKNRERVLAQAREIVDSAMPVEPTTV